VKGNKGFSLLELLVVVAILGILIAIALPRYFDAVADAKRNAQRTNIAIIRTSLEYYRNKNNSYPTDTTTFVNFLKDPNYFSETPVCPYNNTTYDAQSSPPSSWTEGYAHILVYQGSAKSYTLSYTAP